MGQVDSAGTRSVADPDESLSSLLTSLPRDVDRAAGAFAARAALLIGTPITVATWTQGRWTCLAGPGTGLAGLPRTGSWREPPSGARGLVAVEGSCVTLCWDPSVVLEAGWDDLLRQGCVWLSLLIQRASADGEIAAADAETQAIDEVVQHLLAVRDLDQVLRAIADRTLRLLDSDICGVMLREGDVVRMRSCVGNRVAQTARLRMARGQGVAGKVFLTGEPAKVDSYIDDETISQDFMSLAVQEETRSALAVPLRLRDEFVGVLEVWRRRTSVFTQRDIRRMVTLADFAAIAIDNARLHDEQAAATQEVETARDALQRQVVLFDRASGLQQKLLATVVEGGGLPAIARAVAVDLDCEIGVYGADGESIVTHSASRMVGTLPETLPKGGRTRRGGRAIDPGWWIRPVYADGDQAGQVAIVQGANSAELMSIIAGQIAMACSLALLRERAANRARSEAIEQVLWDLLEGPVEHRLAARSRARQLGIQLTRSLRVVHGRINNLQDLAAAGGWAASYSDTIRRDVLRVLRSTDERGGLALAGMRGDELVAIAVGLDRSQTKDLVTGVVATAHADRPDMRMTWGISREHHDVVELTSALNEARTAEAAARRFGRQDIFLYEELGIVRLLLGSGSDPDLQTFVDEVTAPLLAYDRDNDGSLVRTLRAFFDADCSQRLAAEHLFVHHKTLRYRLERIRQLTGLDLSRHEDRMRADFALRLLQVNQTASDENAEPG